jgi:phosphoserine phosphatase
VKQLSQNPITHFSENYFRELQNKIDQALAEGAAPIAAFDADGTLWDLDIGETFFDYQIRHCDLPQLKEVKDPWTHYLELKKTDHRAAYTWLAQINENQTLAQVRQWAEKAIDQIQPFPVLHSMQGLIQFLKTRNVQVFIVTASVKWAVEPAALKFYGIPYENVLGVETKVVEPGPLITAEGKSPVTWREGKAEALLQATAGRQPFLAVGNTDGDTALLESSSHWALAVATQDFPNALFAAELALQKEASRRGWLSHLFRSPLLDPSVE